MKKIDLRKYGIRTAKLIMLKVRSRATEPLIYLLPVPKRNLGGKL